MQSYDNIYFFIHDGFYCAHTGAGIHNFRTLRILREVFPSATITVCPVYTSTGSPDYQKEWHETVMKVLAKDNINVAPIDNGTNGLNRYGGVDEWRHGARSAYEVVQSSDGLTLCISVDTPFVGLIPLFAHSPFMHLHIPKSSSMLHDKNNVERLELENHCFQTQSSNTRLGAIGEFMREHLVNDYVVPRENVVDLFNGCLPEDNVALPKVVVSKLKAKWNMGDERMVVAAYGRSIEYKGFHTLVEAMKSLDSSRYRLLINANVDSPGSQAYTHRLVQAAELNGVDLTIHSDFDPYFPAFIRRNDKTLAVVAPSLFEPFGLIPSEVMSDPFTSAVVICSDADGLSTQISNGITGFLYQKGNSDDLERQLMNVARLSILERRKIITTAFEKSGEHFNLRNNFRKGLLSARLSMVAQGRNSIE